MMLYGCSVPGGSLEVRSAGKSRRLTGRFPYDELATLSDGGRNGGRPKKERIAKRAFRYRIEQPDEDIHLLVGHSYDRPLASRASSTLDVRETDDAVVFDAELTPEVLDISWVIDFLRALEAGLIRGISPGFRLPPQITVAEAERVEDEDPKLGRAIIRTVLEALLYELSFVTVAAYRAAFGEERSQIEARSWDVTGGGVVVPAKKPGALRWR